MSDIVSFLKQLREALDEERQKQSALQRMQEELGRDPIFSGHLEKKIRRVQGELEVVQKEMESLTHLFLRVPPWHLRHQEALKTFFQEASYESSVFVMTKFPEGDTPEDNQLKAVIAEVCSVLDEYGLTPRIANGARFHAWLWDEVEVHLLGCAMGIAIVEDRYSQELNPNVAMEWGWMRAMGKRVLFLREASFSQDRADLGGLRSWSFEWDNPAPGVRKALTEWLS